MRDHETGTWWQQITGQAIYGPLKGAALELVLSDELTFGEWKAEISGGQVLAEVPKYVKEYDSNWEPEVAKYPVPFKFPGTPLKPRDVVVGLQVEGPGRAYPWDTLLKESPVVDSVNGKPLLVAVGPDGKSFRVFISRIEGKDAEFFFEGEADGDAAGEKTVETKSETKPEATNDPKTDAPPAGNTEVKNASRIKNGPSFASQTTSAPVLAKPADTKADVSPPKPAPAPKPWIMLDTTTGSEWNFQGCAISGPSQGKCLDRVPALKDFWFDWRNYHPQTTVYKH